MGGDPFAFPTIVGGGGGRWFPFPTEFGLQHPFIFLKEKKKEDTFPAPAWVHLHLCFSLSLKKKTQSWDEDKASSSLSDLFWRLYLTPPLTFWRRRLGNNDLHRKRDGHHSDFPTVVEAESGKLISTSATSNAHPYTTLPKGNLKREERLQLKNYLEIIMDSNIIPKMRLTPIMKTLKTEVREHKQIKHKRRHKK